ncbi:hypothetical protein [Fictibacillus sp. S7]|uniref:hypothetical protein n=1 Tax=Fictibacillus sp. S7 TaxID=2212476 RepID=UPI001010EDC3|nr:hypothetical protein [Fictibacillus sp. S7]RXY98880.1 hypothetical protein DMO16_03875 [Fictibacillus sp. S7]
MLKRDSKSNCFIETDVSKIGKDESIRVTLVDKGYTGSPCLRIQIRKHDTGQVYMGPEFPIEYSNELIKNIKILQKQV